MEMQQRLEKLEKERWAYLGLASLAVIAGLLGALMGAGIFGSGGDTLRASKLYLRGSGESLVLMEPGGKPRAALGLSDAGLPTMQFFDANNKRRQVVGLSTNSNPQIQFYDREGKLAAELHINDQGFPMLAFLDELQTRRETLGLQSGGEPSLEFFDLNNNPQLRFTSARLEYHNKPLNTAPAAAVPAPQPGKTTTPQKK